MIKTCEHCGAVNGDPTDVCSFCDAPFSSLAGHSVSRRVAHPTQGNLAVEPEWRREISSRVQDYRARRRGGAGPDLQSALPFEPEPSHRVESEGRVALATAVPARKAATSRTPRSERFEIAIPGLDAPASARPGRWPGAASVSAFSSPVALYPVASLMERRRAAIVDVVLLIFSYGGMLALFTVLGGHIGVNKTDIAVAGATLALFYAQYFALFTIFGGSTPGMMLRGLRVVSFDGNVPTSRQMAWRSFGYLISAGTCFLGFLWSLWDEDQLCWHDRISQTYLARLEEITAP